MTERLEISQKTLEECYGDVRFLLARIRSDANRIEEIVTGLELGDPSLLSPRQTTAGGSLRGLPGKIKAFLEAVNTPLTTAEIARGLFTKSSGISFDLYKRRVIVTVSAMSKKDNPVIVPVEDVPHGREKLWVLAANKDTVKPRKGPLRTENDFLELENATGEKALANSPENGGERGIGILPTT